MVDYLKLLAASESFRNGDENAVTFSYLEGYLNSIAYAIPEEKKSTKLHAALCAKALLKDGAPGTPEYESARDVLCSFIEEVVQVAASADPETTTVFYEEEEGV